MGTTGMGQKLSGLGKREYGLQLAVYTLIFLILGIASSLLGVHMESHAASSTLEHAAGALFHDIGVAFLVGIILMWTLERTNKARVQSEVQEYISAVGENFLKAVYGKELPQEMFEVIRRTLLNESFIRSVYNVQVSLRDFNDESIKKAPGPLRALLESFRQQAMAAGFSTNALLVFKSSNFYEVRNVSRSALKYPLSFELAKPFGGRYEGLCGITSIRINGVEKFAGATPSGEPRTGEDPTLLRYYDEVDVPPGGTVQVQVEAYSLRRNEDKEPWQTLRPCKAMNISVEDEDGNKDVVISLDAPMFGGMLPFAKKDPKTNKASLAVPEYLLPYQGVTISWMPCLNNSAHHQAYHGNDDKN